MKKKRREEELPPFENEAKKVRVSSLAERNERRREYKDAIYYEKITEEKLDTAKPLKKGGVDMWFLLWSMVLLCFGIVMCYSAGAFDASMNYDDSTYYLLRNILFSVVAVGVTIPFVIWARPWFWRAFGIGAYGAAIVLLIAVLLVGKTGGGAERWIDLGFITVQPSEIAKLAIVMVLALYLEKHEKQVNSLQKFGGHFRYAVLYPILTFGLICALVMLEHHLSGIIIIGVMGLATMYIGGTDKKWFMWIGGIGIVAVLAVLLVSDYAMLRVTTWLNIENVDPLGSAWQTLQGLNAIGSGGFFGRGLGNSQQKYGYVSQPQNDFIFTIVCEELGFVGALAVVLLFGLLVWRGFRIASKAPDKFSSIVAYGLITKVALQAILNIAVVTNSIPNTGIALPFFSSGGTSLILQIFEMGLVLSISRYSYEKR